MKSPGSGGSEFARLGGDPPRSEHGAAGTEARRAPAGARGGCARPIIVGITGASGAPYAVRLVECIVRAGRPVHLIITAAGRLVLADELAARAKGGEPDLAALWPREIRAGVTYTPAENLAAPPASGSFDAQAAVIIPCSMNTLAALAGGLAGNLVQRAAYVALKEGRPLIVVPREMPVTRIDLENMARLAAAGAIVMPAMPGFYHRPKSAADIVDFVVAKVLDRLGIPHDLAVAWPAV
jgi:4-hydroxy-3-polyprenylbenzoate decarboxylase